MASTVKKIVSNKPLMKKILFTLLAVLVYKLVLYIQIPLVFKEFLPISGTGQSWFDEGSVFEILNSFTGGGLQSLSVVALGVGPYITASIIVQLLQTDIIPIFSEWSEEGQSGKQKLNQTTRYIAIILAFVQALAMTIAFNDGIFDISGNATLMHFIYLAILITAGTAFLLWLGDQITKKGIGNGISMIIVSGIIITFPTMVFELIDKYMNPQLAADGMTTIAPTVAGYVTFGFIMAIFLLVIVAVVFIQLSVRKIPVQYSNRQASSKDSNIPIKLNSAGVIPVIFAVTILTIPTLITSVITDSTPYWVGEVFNYQKPIGYIIYVILIFLLAIFYSFMQINPEKISDNLQKQGAFIPGIRPGEETAVYISKVLFKITLLGALFLVVIASLPLVTTMIFDLPSSVQIGGTSLLIVVGVAIETGKQIETEISEKTYKGFLR